MTIKAEIIKDSIGPNKIRLTTFVLTYPRFIHSEFMTHRNFSRSSSSSRAIPFEKQVQAIKDDMAMPLEFRSNKPGMQAGEALSLKHQEACRHLWKESFRQVLKQAKDMHLFGVHKQYINRLLEPYSHITVVVSATEYANFFALRYHSMAQPEMYELAKQMWEAYQASVPVSRPVGHMHLPFVSEEEYELVGNDTEMLGVLLRKSVACCARVSYMNHDSTKPTQEQNDDLFERLVGSDPKHSSPAEHQAKATELDSFYGNFRGWLQLRKMIENENITEFKGPKEDL